jgi:hypothetical protein
MRRQIRLTTRRELAAAIRQRYQVADQSGKKMILDEFTEVTGYHRKHAIRVLTTQHVSEPKTRAVRRVYQEAVKEALIVLWEASDRICGKRLKTLLPLLAEAMERHGHLQLEDGVRTQLLAMSASTIDRQLHSVRERARGGRKRSSATNRVRLAAIVFPFSAFLICASAINSANVRFSGSPFLIFESWVRSASVICNRCARTSAWIPALALFPFAQVLQTARIHCSFHCSQ